MENAADQKAVDGEIPPTSAGGEQKEPDKFVNWIECRYEIDMGNAVKKLEVDDHVTSNVFGTGNLQWVIDLIKRGNQQTSDSTNDKASDDRVSIYLRAVNISGIPGGIRSKFNFGVTSKEYDGISISSWAKHILESYKISLFDAKTPSLGRRNRLTLSKLKSFASLNISGSLKFNVIMLIENSHSIAYDLATNAHSLRVAELGACNNKTFNYQRPLFIEIRASYFETDDENESIDDFCDDKSKFAAAVEGKGQNMHALGDVDLNEETISTDSGGMQQVPADEISGAKSSVALTASPPPQYESIRVWKSLLVQASPVFKAMFEEEGSGTVESETGIVVVEDFPYEVVKAFVNYISCGPIEVELAEHSVLAKLVRMADKYEVKDLYNVGVALMLKSIQAQNVAEYYATAYLLDIADLKAACIAAIKQKWNVEAEKPEFWSSQFRRFGKKIMAEAIADYAKLG